MAYAISGTIAVIFAGWLIDKFSARRMFPFFLLPMALGILLIMFSESQWSYTFFLILAGISTGIGSPVKDAVIAEIYGIKTIGTVRSLFTAMMVLSTAAGPPIFGYFIDYYSFNYAFSISIMLIVLSSFAGILALRNQFVKK